MKIPHVTSAKRHAGLIPTRQLVINVGVVLVGLLTFAARAQLPPTPEKPAPGAEAKPRLFVETRNHNLGKILEGDLAKVAWKIENRGTADLIIDHTSSACGCTVVKLREEDKIIRPGATLELQVEFNSTGRLGEQNKTIEVFSNDPLEPTVQLGFKGEVEMLYSSDPTSVVNLRVLRRGETAQRPLELIPMPGHGTLTVTSLEVENGAPIEVKSEPFEKGEQKGVKILFTISDSAALGSVNTSTTVKFRVDDVEREKSYSVRGEIVGDLTWLPKVLDATRQPSIAGKSLAPITVTSTDERPFRILEADGGPLLAVSIAPGRKPNPETEYLVQVEVSASAPPGPFGTSLRIVTNSLDQPVIEVPVFGIVAPIVEIDPSTVLLRKDGTPAGTNRRLRIKTANASPMRVQTVSCDSPAITVAIDATASASYTHLVIMEAQLTGVLPQGTHQSVIRITTDVKGAEKIEIPVRIEIP